MKNIKAVPPYLHPGPLNFKSAPYEAWNEVTNAVAPLHYPWRFLHGLFFRWELPTLWKCKTEARLRFVEPVSISFDTFPDYACFEVVLMIWDCWPCYFEKLCVWLEKHQVRTAIFTSMQTAERMQERFPQMHIFHCPEGIDTSKYAEGKRLKERSIDVLEFGRSNGKVLKSAFPSFINHVCTKQKGQFVFTNEELFAALGDAKITIALPRSITQPEIAGDIETLTQRYWENMLSRIVMVGHAPQELVDLIGYNPVIEMDFENPKEQIMNILSHIEDYQDLVDKNRKVALEKGDWKYRMNQVKQFLIDCGYEI